MNQQEAVMHLLESGPKTTNEIIQAPFGLAAEYRRAISELRKKIRPKQMDIVYKHGRGAREPTNWSRPICLMGTMSSLVSLDRI